MAIMEMRIEELIAAMNGLKLTEAEPETVASLPLNRCLQGYSSITRHRLIARLEDMCQRDFRFVDSDSTFDEILKVINNADSGVGSEKTKNESFGGCQREKKVSKSIVTEAGIDIESVDNMPGDLLSSSRNSFRSKVFHASEVVYALRRDDPIITLTGIFAAKEAVKKIVVNHGINPDFNNIIILHASGGKPILYLNEDRVVRARISISHTQHYAVSMCIADVTV